MAIIFDREKLKTKKEITFNLLKNKICDNCLYYRYSITSSSGIREVFMREQCCCCGNINKVPELRTCKRWKNDYLL